jgi:hypothetical protein
MKPMSTPAGGHAFLTRGVNCENWGKESPDG